ncbi:MAG: DMT family transporter [Magnetovibrio sp.]|nr:DMT family transporter [Magnetovibrio sp.]
MTGPDTDFPKEPAGRRDNPALGILMMVAAIGFLSSMNLFIKLIGPDYHPMQVTFLRNLVAAAVILPFILRIGGAAVLKTRRPWMHGARALGGILGNACYFYAFARLPLADVMVISQAVPLFATALAVVFLNERVGWRRWTAIVVGFGGVAVAIDPTGAVSTASLVTVVATVFWASTILLMRSLGATESPYTVVFYYMAAGTVMAGLFMPWVWATPPLEVLGFFVAAGVLGALGQYFMTHALKVAEASVVSPFNYTAIVWGLLFDLAVWSIWPSWPTVIGAIIISAAGLYLFRREAGLKRRAGS